MKKVFLAYVLIVSFFLTACNGGGEQYGSGLDPNAPKVQVEDIFLKPDLIGKNITVEGRIATQCASNGCWFYLKDETGQVYIDLSYNGFALPSLPNKKAIATGMVARSKSALLLVATGVEVR